MPEPRTAIVWLTHFDDPEALAAAQRLSLEAAPYGDIFLCHSREDIAGSASDLKTLIIRNPDLEASIPVRFAQMVNAGIKLYQMLDLLHFAAMRQLPDFDYWWFFEYDTDFSAGWEHFFKLFCDCHADLVGSTLYPRNMDPNWFHWPKFRAPAHVRSEMHTRGFFPVVRLSRKFAEVYQSEMRNTWRGTFEALYPTIAVSNGLLVEDIGGSRGKGCPGIGATWIA